MKKFTFKNWLLFFGGVIVFLIGCYYIFAPVQVVYLTALMAAIGILIEGFTRIVSFFTDKDQEKSLGLLLFSGIIDVVFGVILLLNLNAAVLILCLLVGVWFMISSIFRIVLSFEQKKHGHKKWWITFLLGIISTGLSFWVLSNPIAGGIVISLAVSIALISTGIMIIAESFNN